MVDDDGSSNSHHKTYTFNDTYNDDDNDYNGDQVDGGNNDNGDNNEVPLKRLSPPRGLPSKLTGCDLFKNDVVKTPRPIVMMMMMMMIMMMMIMMMMMIII